MTLKLHGFFCSPNESHEKVSRVPLSPKGQSPALVPRRSSTSAPDFWLLEFSGGNMWKPFFREHRFQQGWLVVAANPSEK